MGIITQKTGVFKRIAFGVKKGYNKGGKEVTPW